MKIYFYIILPILVFSLLSCEKELNFKYHNVEPQLVIEGVLSQEEARVCLSNTTPMNEKIENDYLTDAVVYLRDNSSSQIEILHPNRDGIYTSKFDPSIGDEYELIVERNGKVYSSSCMMRPATRILGLLFQWIKMPYDYVAVLQITFIDFESIDDCYWIKIYRNDEPYKWIISDDRSAVTGVITEVIMTTRKDLKEEDEKDILEDGDEVRVVINTISREMYDYLTAIENNSNGQTMFEGEFCLGYFMASDSVSDTIIFHPDKITQYE